MILLYQYDKIKYFSIIKMDEVKYYYTTKTVCTCGTRLPDIFRELIKYKKDKHLFFKDNKITRMCCISSLTLLTSDLMSDIDGSSSVNELTGKTKGIEVESEIIFKTPIF
jgi:hypothetical protein